jgi:hypothetical protein
MARRFGLRRDFAAASAAPDEAAILQLRHGLAQLLLGIHHDGAVPGHRLLDGLARDEQEAMAQLVDSRRQGPRCG